MKRKSISDGHKYRKDFRLNFVKWGSTRTN